jgi:hypothetical protein
MRIPHVSYHRGGHGGPPSSGTVLLWSHPRRRPAKRPTGNYLLAPAVAVHCQGVPAIYEKSAVASGPLLMRDLLGFARTEHLRQRKTSARSVSFEPYGLSI